MATGSSTVTSGSLSVMRFGVRVDRNNAGDTRPRSMGNSQVCSIGVCHLTSDSRQVEVTVMSQ